MFQNESTTFEELEHILSSGYETVESLEDKEDLSNEYERLLDSIIHETNDILSTNPDVKNRAVKQLSKLMSEEFPVGMNGINAKESLRGIIDDPMLNRMFEQMSKEDSNTDAKEAILNWIKENAPEIENDIEIGEGPEDLPVPVDHDEAEHTTEEIVEFVKSLYDATTGNFPRGETGVIISAQKKFGDHAVGPAKECIENLKHGFDENIMRMRKLAGVS